MIFCCVIVNFSLIFRYNKKIPIMKKSLLQLAILAVLGITVALAANLINEDQSDLLANTNADDEMKVLICHIPPGNPDNAHTIEVSINAVPAHLAHGCSLGSCDGGGDDTSGDDTSAEEEKVGGDYSPSIDD